LMAYAVSRRTREIGIRMALGALPGSVLRMVLRQGGVPTAIGVVGGIAASVAAGRGIDAMFPTTTAADIWPNLLVAPGVALVAMLAAYVPARRASRIQPLAALRQD
jgi:ABC-type antimicrobial peptide transport system permease subunit